MVRVLIVDDEPLARIRIRDLLAEHADVLVIAECGSASVAVDAIRQLEPDLVFLDIQMPEMDGFDVLRAIRAERMPAIVFVTAHHEYALRAFDVEVVDYITKPIGEERFAEALDRARRALAAVAESTPDAIDDVRSRITTLIGELRHRESADARPPARLAVRRDGRRVTFVPITAIDWLEAMGNYVRVHAGQDAHIVSGTLTKVVGRLPSGAFLRIHRSAAVNVERVEEVSFERPGRYVVRLTSHVKLSVGRRYRGALAAIVSNRC
ncbi:MAG TPA: LytTR family DNA-binding domain-containing protein [Acidothermaceae bacterium]|nr:LytTR family DNA-binding domain-containing protein [Acidothermaceae bacterium]